MTQALQCPGCHAKVAVDDDAGGSRVACPHCDRHFVVPGFVGTSSGDDDDWLSLDEPFSNKAPSEPESLPSTIHETRDDDDDLFEMDFPSLAPVKPRPNWSDSSSADIPSGTHDRDASKRERHSSGRDHRSGAETSASPSSPRDDIDDLDESLPAVPATKATPIEYATDFKIKCRICGSHLDVTARQSGQQIKCHDCHTVLKVPPPPKKKPKPQIDLETASTFTFGDSAATRHDRPADPFRRSANELLAAAEAVDEDEPDEDFDVPKIGEWLQATFGVLTQLSVLVHWLILSAVASLIGGVVLSIGTDILILSLFPLGLFFATMTLACGFSILQSIANHEDSVDEWPMTLEPSEWIGPTLFCVTAAALAGGPAWFLGSMAFDQSLTTVAICMLSIFVLFPFVLLSMLDMQNIFVPFSPEVGRSVTRCEEAWGGFYLSAGILFFATFLIFTFASMFSAVANLAIAVTVGVAATFVYFALIGRLAYAIGQSVNDEPMVNDIDAVREAERQQS